MKRLTFDGLFCDIAKCDSTPGETFCETGTCTQRRVWERLKEYEETGLEPEEITNALGVPMTTADRIRAMSDKELAKFLYDFFWGRKEQVRLFNLEKWLQQPAEEEEHDRRTEIKH